MLALRFHSDFVVARKAQIGSGKVSRIAEVLRIPNFAREKRFAVCDSSSLGSRSTA
jgi:hypothetical protein